MYCFMCLSTDGILHKFYRHTKNATYRQITFVLPKLTIPKSQGPIFICSACQEQVVYFFTIKRTSLGNFCLLNNYNYILEERSDQIYSDLKIVIKKVEVPEHQKQDAECLIHSDPEDLLSSEEQEEEEIDVVTIDENQLTTNRNCTVLSTNLTMRNRQKLQRISGLGCWVDGEAQVASSSQPRNWCISDSDFDGREKRSVHNHMERQRRFGLRNAFNELRILVPDVSEMEHASKVLILREATIYCYKLYFERKAQEKEVDELQQQLKKLRERFSQLRRSLTAKR